jgi:zinc resistance-associated protein
MKRFPKILVATCAAVALSSSLALAVEPAAAPAPMAAHAGHLGMVGAHGPMMGMLGQLSPEKQEVALKLMDEHAKALFPMHQDLYAKYAALEAANAAGEGDSAKARGIIRDIADLNAKMLTENSKFRTRIFKETGLRVPLMGHGMMGMGGMMGGKGGCGGMMGGMKGGMMGQMGPMGAQPSGAAAGQVGSMSAMPGMDTAPAK